MAMTSTDLRDRAGYVEAYKQAIRRMATRRDICNAEGVKQFRAAPYHGWPL